MTGSLFRRAAVERLSGPERLDELVLLVPARRWLLAAGAAAVAAAALLFLAFSG